MPRRAIFVIYERRLCVSAGTVRTKGIALKFVMCEQVQMERKPGTMELAERAGISKSYASEIVNDQRKPSRPLAIHIFRQTGWRHPLLDGLTDEQLAMLEAIERWTPAVAA